MEDISITSLIFISTSLDSSVEEFDLGVIFILVISPVAWLKESEWNVLTLKWILSLLRLRIQPMNIFCWMTRFFSILDHIVTSSFISLRKLPTIFCFLSRLISSRQMTPDPQSVMSLSVLPMLKFIPRLGSRLAVLSLQTMPLKWIGFLVLLERLPPVCQRWIPILSPPMRKI